MLFQLIGQSSLNQKAREVAPFRYSLSSSGLYIMIAKMRVIFWIGQDYYDCYLNQSNYTSQQHLIHPDLMVKLLYIYEKATNFGTDQIDDKVVIE